MEHTLIDGQCARIATGAVVPDGAEAVLKVERSLLDAAGGCLELSQSPIVIRLERR